MSRARESTGQAVLAIVAGLGVGCGGADATPPGPSPAPAAVQPAAPEQRSEGKLELPAKTPHFEVSKEIASTVSGKGEGPYRFTAPWHTKVAGNWAKVLQSYSGKPNLSYLEIGVFEGRSVFWMLENILTHPTSKITAIDVFMGDYEQTFDANVKASGAGKRITKIKGPSQRELRAMTDAKFDIIYIDGSHTADDVIADAVLSWALLKTDGLMIFDDYEWKGRPDGGLIPIELRPRVAIDMFVTAHRSELELVHRDYQVIVRKVENPCEPKDYCTPVGQYQYYWRDFELRKAGGAKVELSPEETKMIEHIAHSKQIGDIRTTVPAGVKSSKEYQDLVARLELDLEN